MIEEFRRPKYLPIFNSEIRVECILFLLSFSLLALTFIPSCQIDSKQEISRSNMGVDPYLLILGVAQDAGYPQAGCTNQCCKDIWHKPELFEKVSCIALIDPVSNDYWLFDATPDFKTQIAAVSRHMGLDSISLPSGIFLTHAHIGHYTGLMDLGHEVIGANRITVYAMPRMKSYLEENGPWSQLVQFENIRIIGMDDGNTEILTNQLSVVPMRVPHREEYSEAVGFLIDGKDKRALFIPDIDKWDEWDRDISELVQSVDYAFLDGTFFKNGEISHRDMSEIKHPFIEESMERFKHLPSKDKLKVHFIHFNHTNPVLWDNGEAKKEIMANGFQIAEEGTVIGI